MKKQRNRNNKELGYTNALRGLIQRKQACL